MSVRSHKDRRRWRAWFFFQGVHYYLTGYWPHPSTRLQSTKSMHRFNNADGREPWLVAAARAAVPEAMDHRNTYKGIPF